MTKINAKIPVWHRLIKRSNLSQELLDIFSNALVVEMQMSDDKTTCNFSIILPKHIKKPKQRIYHCNTTETDSHAWHLIITIVN